MADQGGNDLARRLNQYPPNALPFFKGAFSVASTLSEDTRAQILDALIKNFKRGRRQISGSPLRAITGLNALTSEQIASLYSLLIGLFSETDGRPDNLVETGRGRLFDEADEAAARSIATAICERRAEIADGVELAQLAGAVLPSLAAFDVSVDVRVKIAAGKVRLSVPIAVVHIETDVEDNFSLQLSQGDVEDLIATLTSALEEMAIAAAAVVTG